MNHCERTDRMASCKLRFLLVVAMLTLPATVGNAQLNGHNLRGDYGLMAGSQPPPGIWVGLLYPNVDIDKLRDRDGNDIPSNLDLDYHAIAPYLWWVSKRTYYGSVTLRYYWDFGVESNAESQTFLFNFTMPVPFQSLTE